MRLRHIIGWSGAAFGLMCSVALVLGMWNVLPGMEVKFLHQTGFRWLAEGAAGGLIAAAVAFWQTD